MSGQPTNNTTPARIRSSPNSGKQGPLKATIPMSSVLKQNMGIKTSTSPSRSPPGFWKTRRSPDHSSGQRSPGSCVYKVKSKLSSNGNSPEGSNIRRTVSLDTLYLKGQWPRDHYYWHAGTLQIDKTTQTEDSDWVEFRKIDSIVGSQESREKIGSRPRFRSKELCSRAGSVDNTYTTSSQTLTSCLSPLQKANPVMIPLKPISRFSLRSSIEGLNQEIEKIVLKTASYWTQNSDRIEDFDKLSQVTPEGHRAPLAELFRNSRSRSVNTQTPTDFEPYGSSCHLSGPPSRESLSPCVSRHLDSPFSDTGGSPSSSPDQEGNKFGTSPQINRFLAREPPDGCEKVHLRLYDEKMCIPLENMPQPPRMFKLKPSLGSAFQILHPNLNNSSERDSPVPSQHNI